MPLQRIDGEIVRERHGFAFPMRIAGTAQSVQVIVEDDALVVTTSMLADDELRTRTRSRLASARAPGGRKIRPRTGKRQRGCHHLRKRRSRFLQLRAPRAFERKRCKASWRLAAAAQFICALLRRPAETA